MSDAQTETPSEPTPVAEVAAPEAATEPEASKAPDAPAGEVQQAAAEEIKPAEEEAKKVETVEETKTEESADTPAAEEPVTAEEQIEEVPAPEPIEIPDGNGELVLVTGATGYLASHIVKQLVTSGQFRVRGTVRTIEGNTKLDQLKSLVAQDSKYELEFVEADLTKADTWTAAVKGCDYVIHTASPFPVTEPENASDVIDPARDGTLSVLKACVEVGGVRRVVLTSSIVAITSGRTLDKNACNEEMWADIEKSSSAYDKSKAIAEKAAWDFVKNELPEGTNLELSVVNPGFIVGPPLMNMDSTSLEVFKKLMNREYSVLPKISFACSDVRDVALAHIRAMMIKQAAGHRHIVCKATVWLKDMANMMSQEFNSQGFNIPTAQAPYVLVWIKSHFDPAIKRILPSIGKMHIFDTKRMREVLQVEPREVKDSLLEMGHAMINLEIVQKVEKPDKKSRKLTLKKKKEKDLEDGEEKKDEPEKAASTSGSAENGSAPDAPITIEDVEVIADDSKAPEIEEIKSEQPQAAAEEVKAEAADAAGSHSEEEVKDEATTSDPESSKKKDKKEKPKKEKKEKKKGGLFSFSFKKAKKPHVEKKSDEDKEDAAPAADEAAPAADEAEAVAEAAVEETTAAVEETPATAEETPAAVEETLAAVEETPAPEEKATVTVAESKDVPAPTETSAKPEGPTTVEVTSSSEPAAADSTETSAE